ncbi:hypothetical protein NE237_016747 [Protea cynaroides]|uniref:DUF241 domain protein n=1 Tax=Protea cynaroides TaxID=273540 RepID=A0A9Q0HHH9_9MAGN|nr:hypothetical protein NE237_016747 [Protea cynaroides]
MRSRREGKDSKDFNRDNDYYQQSFGVALLVTGETSSDSVESPSFDYITLASYSSWTAHLETSSFRRDWLVVVEEQLQRLRASEATSSSSASSSSICYNLGGLRDLYETANNLLQLPLTQQTLAQERGEKWVDEVLDGSLRSLDVCGRARDVLSQMKECMTQLQSSLRRIRGESGLANEVEAYNLSRKKVTKVINKCLGDVQKVEKQRAFPSLLDKNQDIVAMVSVLREVEAITLSMFDSMLSFISGPKAMLKPNGWSLISKLINKKTVACDRKEMERCGFEKVDATLGALLGHKAHKGLKLKHVEAQKQLETLELSIRDLEDGLECIFRSLIKTRVSLLNSLNQ